MLIDEQVRNEETIRQNFKKLAKAVENAGNGLPDQTGHAGEYLSTDGTDAGWKPVSRNIDGGVATSIYLPSQNIDGGNA